MGPTSGRSDWGLFSSSNTRIISSAYQENCTAQKIVCSCCNAHWLVEPIFHVAGTVWWSDQSWCCANAWTGWETSKERPQAKLFIRARWQSGRGHAQGELTRESLHLSLDYSFWPLLKETYFKQSPLHAHTHIHHECLKVCVCDIYTTWKDFQEIHSLITTREMVTFTMIQNELFSPYWIE